MAKVVSTEVLGKPKEYHWVRYINQRIQRNKNFLGFFSGQTGSGKSWSCISVAEMLDSEFSIDRIVFDGLELMRLIDSGTLRSGSVIVFEEVGVAANSRNWYSTFNKMLNYLLQTFRHRNFILLMNAPYMDFIDSGMRKLFHAEFMTIQIDKKTSKCKVKPQCIQYNGRLSKFYYKRLKAITERGAVPVTYWFIPKPQSKELIKAYEQKKLDYTQRLNKEIKEEFEGQEAKKKGRKELTDVQQEVVDCLKKGITIPEACEVLGKTKSVIHQDIRYIRKKGYTIKPIKDGAKVVKYEVTEPEQ